MSKTETETDSAIARNGLPASAQAAVLAMHENGVGEKLKTLERSADTFTLPPNVPFVIRLDGVSFSKFTKGLVKPFDRRLTEAMVETTKDLVLRFTPVTGYTCSDEISLVFSAASGPSETATHLYNGRAQKLSSVTASFAAARLNFHLNKHEWSDLLPVVQERMRGHIAFFDGRVIPTPDERTAMECIFWRSNFDSLRNAISLICGAHFTQKEMHGRGLTGQLKMLESKEVKPFESFSSQCIFGTWVKREQYCMHDAVNIKTGEAVDGPVTRTRLRIGSFNWADWSAEERTAFVIDKYWPLET
jgi:tRNA(His) 5'-end guanylyltransferase